MNDATQPPVSFEQSLKDLEQIVRALEDGDISLEESLAQYEKGVGLLKLCYGQLRQAEQRIQALTGETPDGQPVTQRFAR
jgi:exodeoxyribonuclease VII small subunit